jgi:hypothetical protein
MLLVNPEYPCCELGNNSIQQLLHKCYLVPKDMAFICKMPTQTRYQLASAINTQDWPDFDSYVSACKKVHKGSGIRHWRKSQRRFDVDVFPWKLHIPDIHEINTSKEIRSGGPMRPSYLRSIEEIGGYPTKHYEIERPACRDHNWTCFGVFESISGYRQGNIVTDRKLIAYIRLKRFGELGLYSQILGHGGYLKFGIMYQLHFELIRKLYEAARFSISGIKYVAYAQWRAGGKGLMQWKSKVLFCPTYILIPIADVTTEPIAGNSSA